MPNKKEKGICTSGFYRIRCYRAGWVLPDVFVFEIFLGDWIFVNTDNKMLSHLGVCWIPQNHFSTSASLTTVALVETAELQEPAHPPPLRQHPVLFTQNQQLSPFQVGSLCPYFLASDFTRVSFHRLRNMVFRLAQHVHSLSLHRTSRAK